MKSTFTHPGEEQVFEKHRLRDGLVRAVSLTLESKPNRSKPNRRKKAVVVVWTGGAWGLRFFSQIEVKWNDSLTRCFLDTKCYWDCITKAAPTLCLRFFNAFQTILCFSKITNSARNGHITGKCKLVSGKKWPFSLKMVEKRRHSRHIYWNITKTMFCWEQNLTAKFTVKERNDSLTSPNLVIFVDCYIYFNFFDKYYRLFAHIKRKSRKC